MFIIFFFCKRNSLLTPGNVHSFFSYIFRSSDAMLLSRSYQKKNFKSSYKLGSKMILICEFIYFLCCIFYPVFLIFFKYIYLYFSIWIYIYTNLWLWNDRTHHLCGVSHINQRVLNKFGISYFLFNEIIIVILSSLPPPKSINCQ